MFDVFIKGKKSGTGVRFEAEEQNELMRKISGAENFSDVQKEFGLLYDSVVHPIWSALAKKFIPPLSQDDLKDVFQEAWCKILEARKSYNPKFSAFNWIFSIKHNMALDRIRKLGRSNIADFEEDYDVISRLPDDEPLVENRLVTDEISILLNEAVESIADDTEREILKRRVMQGQKLEQISAEMNIPLTTVYKKVKKSIEYLRPKVLDIINN